MKPKERILEAADRLFGENGFDATTTRDIAEASGVNKALIHYHFRSKEGLLASVLDAYYKELATTIGGALGTGGDLRTRMIQLMDVYLDFLREHRNFARIVQREASGGKHMERIKAHMVPLFDLGTQAVLQAYPTTTEGALSAQNVLVSFYGMVVSYFTYSDILEQLIGEDPMANGRFEDRKRHLRRMINIILDAVESDEAGRGN